MTIGLPLTAEGKNDYQFLRNKLPAVASTIVRPVNNLLKLDEAFEEEKVAELKVETMEID